MSLVSPSQMSGIGKLGYLLSSISDPSFSVDYNQLLEEQRQQTQLGNLRQQELAMRQEDRARRIAEQDRIRAAQEQARTALGGLSGRYAQQTGIDPAVAQQLISSGVIGADSVLGSLQSDPLQELKIANERLRQQQLQKQLDAPAPVGIADLIQPTEKPEQQYREVEGDGFTKYVPITPSLDSSLKEAQEEKSQIDSLYDKALLTPNFDQNEFKKLESLRSRAAEKLEVKQAEKQNFETLLSTKQDIESKLLSDLNDAKNMIASSKGSFLDPTDYLPGTETGGFEGAVKSLIPGTKADQLDRALKRIRSTNVLNVLAEAKAQSRTGATGFGALSEKELGVIENKIANLEVGGQSDEQLLKNIQDVENDLRKQLSKINSSLGKLGYQEEQPQKSSQAKRFKYNPQTGQLE